MYNIDEENSNITFIVAGDKVAMNAPVFSHNNNTVYIIKNGDNTDPLDTNVYSALAVYEMFVKESGKVCQWDSVFKVITDINGNKYLSCNLPVAVEGGVTAYAGIPIEVDSIYSGLPIDGTTLYWEEGVLKSAGSGSIDLSSYYNKTETDTLLSAKQATLTAGTGIDITNNVITCTVSGGSDITVVNNLTSTSTTAALSANQGRVLNNLIAAKQATLTAGTGISISNNTISCTVSGSSVTVVDNLTSTSTTSALSAYQGKVLKDSLSNYLLTSSISSWALSTTKPSYNFSEIGSKPTTLSGYGITDAANKTDLDSYLPLTGGTVSGNLNVNGTTNLHDTTITGNLLVTGGGTFYGSSSSAETFIVDATTLDGYSSTDTYRVASARVTNLLKTKVNDNASRLTVAETKVNDNADKIAAIKSAISNITSSSTLADLLSAVINIKNNL